MSSTRARRLSLVASCSYFIAACFVVAVDAQDARSNAPAREHGELVIQLRATTYNAGKIGRAFLSPDVHGTRVVVRFSGVPPYVGRPIHVYTYVYDAPCTNLPAKPAWSLNERVLASTVAAASGPGTNGMFTLAHTIPVPLSELLGKRYAIALRTAPADGNLEIFCGDLDAP